MVVEEEEEEEKEERFQGNGKQRRSNRMFIWGISYIPCEHDSLAYLIICTPVSFAPMIYDIYWIRHCPQSIPGRNDLGITRLL